MRPSRIIVLALLPILFIVATTAVAFANDANIIPATANVVPGQTLTFTVVYTDYGGNWFGGTDTVYWTTEGLGSSVVGTDYPGVSGSMSFSKGILGSSQSQTASVVIPAGANPGRQFQIKTYWQAGSNSYMTVTVTNANPSTYMDEPSSTLLKLYLNASNYDGYGHAGSNANGDRAYWQNLITGGTSMPLLGYGYNATSGWQTSGADNYLVSNGADGANVRFTNAYAALNGQSFTIDILYKKGSGAPNFFDNWVTNNGTISYYISGSSFTLYDNAHSANAVSATNAAFLDTTNYHLARVTYNATTKLASLYWDNVSYGSNTYAAGLSFGEAGRDLKLFGNSNAGVKYIKVWAGAGADTTVASPPSTPTYPTPSAYNTVSGFVIDNVAGAYVGGAQIVLKNASSGISWVNATSDNGGAYSISIPNTLPAGAYTLNCSKSGYTYDALSLTLPTANTTHNFYINLLPGAGKVIFNTWVVDDLGQSVYDAAVLCNNTDTLNTQYYYTDALGHAVSAELATGNYVIKVQKDGYAPTSISIAANTPTTYTNTIIIHAATATVSPPTNGYIIWGYAYDTFSKEPPYEMVDGVKTYTSTVVTVKNASTNAFVCVNGSIAETGYYKLTLPKDLPAGLYAISANASSYMGEPVWTSYSTFYYPDEFAGRNGVWQYNINLIYAYEGTVTPVPGTDEYYQGLSDKKRQEMINQMIDQFYSWGNMLVMLCLLVFLLSVLDMLGNGGKTTKSAIGTIRYAMPRRRRRRR